MEKLGIFVIISLLVSGLFIATVNANEENDSDTNSTERSVKIEARADLREKVKTEVRNEIKERITDKKEEFRQKIKERNGQIKIEGRDIRINELTDDKKEIIAGRINAKTGLNLTSQDIGNGTAGAVLRAQLSNGRHAEVKYMPDRASAIALKRLRAKCEERNCSVELREVGNGNRSRLAYVVETEKDSRVFLIFRKNMIVKAEVDAETGEIVSIKKPWWSFITKEKHATDEEIEQEIETDVESDGSETDVSANTSINISA